MPKLIRFNSPRRWPQLFAALNPLCQTAHGGSQAQQCPFLCLSKLRNQLELDTATGPRHLSASSHPTPNRPTALASGPASTLAHGADQASCCVIRLRIWLARRRQRTSEVGCRAGASRVGTAACARRRLSLSAAKISRDCKPVWQSLSEHRILILNTAAPRMCMFEMMVEMSA